MSYKVLLSANFLLNELEYYRKFFNSRNIELIIPSNVNERLTEEELLQYAPYIHGTICGDDEWTEKVIDIAKDLKIISKWGTGIDSINTAYAKLKGIKVTNTPNAFSEPVSDSNLCYILDFARNPRKTTDLICSNKWGKVKGFALNDKTIGVVGMGGVGKATIRKLSMFGCQLLGYDNYPNSVSAQFRAFTGLKIVDFQTLLQESDIIVLCCNLNSSSEKLLSDQQFAIMKKGVCVVNTARGKLIDEKALIKAKKKGIVDGIALDVFETEPLPLNSELKELDNIILAPHNANSSKNAWQFVHYNSINNLFSALGIEQIEIPLEIKRPVNSEEVINIILKQCQVK